MSTPASAAVNDSPNSAQVITPGTAEAPFEYAWELSTPASACFLNRPSVWFTYTPAEDTDISLEADAKAIDVYTGSPGSLTRRTCNDDNGPLGAKSDGLTHLSLSLNGGTTYYLALNTNGYWGSLRLSDTNYTGAAASVDYPIDGGTKTMALGGVITPHPPSLLDSRPQYWLIRAKDVTAAMRSRLVLVSGDRVCPQSLRVGDEKVVNSSGTWATLASTLVPEFDEGSPCDPDGQMDGGSYDLRFDIRSSVDNPWSSQVLGSTDVTGPSGVLRVTTSKFNTARVIDYPHVREDVALEGAVEEQWTDGVWRRSAPGTVAWQDCSCRSNRPVRTLGPPGICRPRSIRYFARSQVVVRFAPQVDGAYRLAAPGQSPSSTSDTIDVVLPTGAHSISELNPLGSVRYIGEQVKASSRVFAKFDDGQWRPDRNAPFRLEYQKKGSNRWETLAKGTANSSGEIDVRFTARAPGSYRITVDGDSSRPRMFDTRKPHPKQVWLRAPYTIEVGQPIVFKACLVDSIRHCLANRKLVLQYSTGGRWVDLDSGRSDGDGWIRLVARSAKLGTYRVISPDTGLARAVTYVPA